MVVLLSLLAATAFALGTVLQQRGTLEDGTGPGAAGVGFLAGLLTRPVWLLGGAVTAVGGLCQTLALRNGTLAGVQALSTLSLVIALPFGVRLTRQHLTPVVWAGAGATTAGIVLFVAVGSPQSGTGSPSALAWWLAGLCTVGLATVCAGIGRRHPGSRQAVLFGAAAGLGFGMASAVMKALTQRFDDGWSAVLTSWEPYVLLAAGLLGLAMGQSALRTGALAPAMAATNAVTLLTSVVLGLTVFGETFAPGPGRLLVVVAGLAVTLLGVVLLTRAPAAGSAGAPATEAPAPAAGS